MRMEGNSTQRAMACMLAAACTLPSAAQATGAEERRKDISELNDEEFDRPYGVPQDSRLEAAGARIGKITINRKNIFDTDLPEEDKALFRAANWLHFQTRESTVKRRLLFKPGDRYDARLLQESERILRKAQFLQDARIFPLAYADGVVDIEVSTQDVWTFQPGISFSRKGGQNNKGISLEETNLFGTGIELGISDQSDLDRQSRSLLFRDRQIGSHWWSLTTEYAENSDGRTQRLELERPFYALDTRWAGGVMVKHDDRVDSLYQGGQVVNQFDTRDRLETVYGGWSAGLRDGWVTRWTAGVTSDQHRAQVRATPLPGTGVADQDRKLVYPWVGVEWVQDDYQQTSNQDQIGKTEDISFGWQTQLMVGYADKGMGSTRNATVFDLKVSKGFQAPPQHTLLLTWAAKGRVEQGHAAGTQFGGTARYFYRYSPRHTFYIGGLFDRGLRLDGDQQLLLGGDSGLRGYPARYQAGDRRWLLTVEQRTYTDWYLFRLFRVGGAAFFDIGRASGGRTPVGATARGTLKDVGVGLRLGNSRTGFGNVVHIDAAFPLDGDKSIKKAQILVETKTSF
jgi:outer membrane protein assembly factor BamA